MFQNKKETDMTTQTQTPATVQQKKTAAAPTHVHPPAAQVLSRLSLQGPLPLFVPQPRM